jgi:nitric oxide dioxygenase
MDNRQIALVQQSYEKIIPRGEELAEFFYAELFAVAPALRSLFDGDLRRQQMKLLMMFALIMRSLHAPDDLRRLLRDLGIKHAGYGVQQQHYTPFGNAFLRMLKDALGAEYTPELHEAWSQALRMLTRIMKESAGAKELGMPGQVAERGNKPIVAVKR